MHPNALNLDSPLSPAACLKAARSIERGEIDGLRTVRTAVLSTWTAEMLKPWLTVEFAARGLKFEGWFGPYNQLEQPVFNTDSGLHAHRPEIVLILTRLEDLLPAAALRFLTLSHEDRQRLLEDLSGRFEQLLEALRAKSSATVLIGNWAAPNPPAAGLADPNLPASQLSFVAAANRSLSAACSQFPQVHVTDCAGVLNCIGREAALDERMRLLARLPYSPPGQHVLARHLARCARAAIVPPQKCLVLDLDNTLWGGIVGEDGFGGIQLGADFPGNVFQQFQEYLLSLKDRGILLAIASRNNEADALEILDRHPDCLLKRDDFAARRIDWNAKSENLRAIANELNIGLDAMVFFDDNPVEREAMRQQVPEVAVIEAPSDPLAFIDAIESSGYFDRLSLSDEDRRRSELYRQETQRRGARASSVSEDEFLHSLEMRAVIGAVDSATLPRVAQLLERTNQFNLTTRRHKASEIGALTGRGAIALWLRLSDRFGDNGLTAAAIARPESGDRTLWRIDSFLMSCRIIGRRAETALLAGLCRRVQEAGGASLTGEFIPSGKNQPAADFFPRHGFTPTDKEHQWRLDLAAALPAFPDCIRVDAPSADETLPPPSSHA